MFHETWSAELQHDAWLRYCWWGVHGLAAASIGLCGLGMHLPSLASIGLTLVSGLFLYRLGHQLPPAWFECGHLSLSGTGARWRDDSGRLLEGEVTWLWASPSLVGLVLTHPEGRCPLWVTRRRMGEMAWWQLQRWLRFQQVQSRKS